MDSHERTETGAQSRLPAGLDIQWRALGGVGRLALVGVGLSLALAIGLGISIERAAERHILQSRMVMLSSTVDDLAWDALGERGYADIERVADLDAAVRQRLVGGGEIVRVKVWKPDGTIVYSDATSLIGRQFEPGPNARRAFAGEPSYKYITPTDPEHVYERGITQLLEFYLPVIDDSGEVLGLFEVYQRTDAIDAALGRIRRNVWLSIGSGLGVLGLFMLTLTATNARELERRRRASEDLLAQLLRVQDEERRRVVGALHDDVGQPLYRLLYGLQGSRARLDPGHPVERELETLEHLVNDIDTTLRGELRELHQGLLDRVDMETAIEELAVALRSETDLAVRVEVDLTEPPPPLVHVALFRAAQEALVNVRKHADATSVAIRLDETGDDIVLVVEDDGRGTQSPDGLGITTMRERLAAVGGGLAITSRNGRGTQIRAWVPAAAGKEVTRA